MQILLQDTYNIGVLTVNIECMWLGAKRMERRALPVSKPRHIISIFTVNTPILYIYIDHGCFPANHITISSTCLHNIPASEKLINFCPSAAYWLYEIEMLNKHIMNSQ